MQAHSGTVVGKQGKITDQVTHALLSPLTTDAQGPETDDRGVVMRALAAVGASVVTVDELLDMVASRPAQESVLTSKPTHAFHWRQLSRI